MGSFLSTTQVHHCPTPEDVFAVRRFLLVFVPVELVNLILDEAKYWPKATMSFEPENPLVVEASHDNSNNAHVCCIATSKLCDLLYDGGEDWPFKIKTVCFKIVSHDQGWCSNHFSGQYEGSYTWFEAVIVRNSTTTWDLGTSYANNPDNLKWNIQRNERANIEFKLHTVVWTEELEGEEADDEESVVMNDSGRGLGRGFVKSLMKEDMIAVMARAQYPAWINLVKSVEMEIYYSV